MNKSTCKLDGCDRRVDTGGYCGMHYQRIRKNGDPGEIAPRLVITHKNNGPCSVAGCDTKARTRGMCQKHYTRWQRTGQTGSHWDLSDFERWESKVRKTSGCWFWTASLNNKGYGTFSVNGRPAYAHRFSYTHHIGPIPAGMHIDHICHNESCVKPSHLRLATRAQNMEYRKGPQVNNACGYRGVYLHKHSGLWAVLVGHGGRKYKGGYFKTPEDADKAARELRAKLHTFPEYEGRAAA